MCIQQMGQRAILAVGSWNLPSVVCIRLSLKSIKGNFHTQFSSEYKMQGRVAGLSPMGIRVAVGKSFVWWQIVTGRLTSWLRETQDQIQDNGTALEAEQGTQMKKLSPTSRTWALMIRKTTKHQNSLFVPGLLSFSVSHFILIFETIHLLIST